MAFHPNYPTDPRVYPLLHQRRIPLGLVVASRRSAAATAARRWTPATEMMLLTVDQPETNHNGGHIAFGPDGFLYIGLGDGGGGGDAHGAIGNGQRLTTLLGKMLRIDVDALERRYALRNSADQSVRGERACVRRGTRGGQCPEIYAYGFRNPWRWSFDRANGELWLADVGQGTGRRSTASPWAATTAGVAAKARTRSTAPAGCIATRRCDRSRSTAARSGNSITGGFVYRGIANPSLLGRYLFGDFGRPHLVDRARHAADERWPRGSRDWLEYFVVRPRQRRRAVRR